MHSNKLVGLVLLVAAVFQTVTLFLLSRGHNHYILRVMKRPFAMVFYAIFAGIMYFAAYKFLAG